MELLILNIWINLLNIVNNFQKFLNSILNILKNKKKNFTVNWSSIQKSLKVTLTNGVKQILNFLLKKQKKNLITEKMNHYLAGLKNILKGQNNQRNKSNTWQQRNNPNQIK
jgi:prophage DNA circulation protein